MKPVTLTSTSTSHPFPLPPAGVGVIEQPQHLYEAMHSYLRDAGVDGVKVDCQAGVGLVGSHMGGGASLSRR